MLEITESNEWLAKHPGATIGLLELSGIDNSQPSAKLDERKREVESQLRERYQGFSRKDFLSLPVMSEYEAYYKRFDKTYHVQLQIESIVLKGKNLPNVSPLVDSNFAAEVQTLILTAGHDVSKLRRPVTIDVSCDGDEITQMNGSTKPIRAGDMIMKDSEAVCCSIIYGQDNRSPITPSTTHVLYVAYAPAGIPEEVVHAQLQGIEENVRRFSPGVTVEQNRLLKAM